MDTPPNIVRVSELFWKYRRIIMDGEGGITYWNSISGTVLYIVMLYRPRFGIIGFYMRKYNNIAAGGITLRCDKLIK